MITLLKLSSDSSGGHQDFLKMSKIFLFQVLLAQNILEGTKTF